MILLNCGVGENPWTASWSNQSILKEIIPEYSLEGLMLKLKIQYFGHLIRRTDSLEKTLMLGKIEDRRRRGQQRMRRLDGITTQWTWVWVNSGSWWWIGRPGVLQSLVHEIAKGWTQLSELTVTTATILKDACSLEENYEKTRQFSKKQRHHFVDRCLYSQSYGFSSSHVWMWELDCKEGLALKNWCFWTVVLEKTLESPSGSKEIKSVSSKGNQPWIFIRTDAEAEAPVLWSYDAKSKLTGKDTDAGKDGRQEEKGTMEDETVGWQHQHNKHESEQTLGDSEGQERLVCCSSNQTWLGDWTTRF